MSLGEQIGGSQYKAYVFQITSYNMYMNKTNIQ